MGLKVVRRREHENVIGNLCTILFFGCDFRVIDSVTGAIEVSNSDFVIDSYLTKDKFINTLYYKEHSFPAEDLRNGYVWFRINAIQIEELLFRFSLCFYNEDLVQVNFRLQDEYSKDLDWTKWSLDKEHKVKKTHDEILIKTFNREPDTKQEDPFYRTTYNFFWGSVESAYDNRSGSSDVTIRYHR